MATQNRPTITRPLFGRFSVLALACGSAMSLAAASLHAQPDPPAPDQPLGALAGLAIGSITGSIPTPQDRALDACNVVWLSPSKNAAGSMPIGNGETGANVWVEEDGDLILLLSRTDAWSEADRLLKLARIRVNLSPNPFAKGKPFRQELKIREGRIEILADAEYRAKLSVYVNLTASTVRIDGTFTKPTTVTATIENIRPEKRTLLDDDELKSSWTMHSAPMDVRKEVWESADTVTPDPRQPESGIVFFHRNEHSIVPLVLKHQGLDTIAAQFRDPLIRRTFGGRMRGSSMSPIKGQTSALRSDTPTQSFDLRIDTHSAQAATLDDWLGSFALAPLSAAKPSDDADRNSWSAFWNRSHINVENDPRISPGPVPKNAHPLRIGADSNGQNRFAGQMRSPRIYSRALADAELKQLANPGDQAAAIPGSVAAWNLAKGSGPAQSAAPVAGAAPLLFRGTAPDQVQAGTDGDAPGLTFRGGWAELAPESAPVLATGFTLSAWVKPNEGSGPARFFDKLTAGTSDGFLFDSHPGDALRLIVGEQTLHVTGTLKRGEWQHIAATYDAGTGCLALYRNGELVKSASPALGTDEPVAPSRVTQAYALQRYVAACGGKQVSGDRKTGAFPIKFNGSIFTVEPVFTAGQKHNADWRVWGGCFWWQNTRLPYYPMLAAGDFDLMDPLFSFYESVLPGCKARATLYHGVQGAYFPETMTTFGTYSNGDYGWDRTGAKPSDVLCPWWQWSWQQNLELAQIMIDRGIYTGDEAFLSERALPMAREALLYYDTRFKRDDRGKLLITPTQAVETYWHDVVNDAPTVAGLHDVCDALLALPERIGTSEDRALWKRMKDAAPALPVWSQKGTKMAAPAEKFKNERNNVETAELYPLWPFREYGLGKPNLDLAKSAYNARVDRFNVGWTQDGMFAALLGLTDEAKANLLVRTRNSHPAFRFPAMWGPNFDWLPDQCHGSNLMSGLQLMLMQCNGREIRILPAWPEEWNVSFKLHAPDRTTVECEYRDGKLVKLVTTPAGRLNDVVVGTGSEKPVIVAPAR